MNSKTVWLCLISTETALALLLAVGAAASYGQAIPLTCLKSRLAPTSQSISANGGQGKWSNCKSECLQLLPCVTPSVTPTKQTSARKRTSPNSTPSAGWATWYSRQSCRREGPGGKRILMANGKPLDDTKMTCALWRTNKYGRPRFPDGSLVKITNAENVTGVGVTVAWTDNGPGTVPRSQNVIIDLSVCAMKKLAGEDGIKAGRVKVTLEAL